jgi:hypothetical protein
MKYIAIITENFSLSYDAALLLHAKKIPFITLSLHDAIPHNVGVVITTEEEAEQISFSNIVLIDGSGADTALELNSAIIEALVRIAGTCENAALVIGIDPGEHPGIALLAGGNLITTSLAESPEATGKVVSEIIEAISKHDSGRTYLIRIGHGAKTLRNRTINALVDFLHSKNIENLNIPIKIVDETSTTIETLQVDPVLPDEQVSRIKNTHQRKNLSDIRAAISIALSKEEGKTIAVTEQYEVSPTYGELREIQRKSRIESGGEITISGELASKVCSGELSIDEAIKKQLSKNR